jgi:hypothetical protein
MFRIMGGCGCSLFKGHDFNEHMSIYCEIVKEIHNLFIPFLQMEYDYEP